MKYKFLIIALILFFGLPGLQTEAAESTPSEGGVFPDITLPVPEKVTEKEYLGLSEKTSFKLSRTKADLVIVEIFSMYCPYCQREAANVNELYRLIDKRIGLKERVKIIGIGAGNTPFEVNVFRDQYNIPFPLFSDESFSIHKSVGEVRTPYFFVIQINPGSPNKIVYSKVGSINDPSQFIETVIRAAGLK